MASKTLVKRITVPPNEATSLEKLAIKLEKTQTEIIVALIRQASIKYL